MKALQLDGDLKRELLEAVGGRSRKLLHASPLDSEARL